MGTGEENLSNAFKLVICEILLSTLDCCCYTRILHKCAAAATAAASG